DRGLSSPPWLDTIGRIFSAIPDLATPREVQSALREILDDPGLALYWWGWGGRRYVDVDGALCGRAPRRARARARRGPRAGGHGHAGPVPDAEDRRDPPPAPPPRVAGVPRLVRPDDPHRDGARSPASRPRREARPA